MSVFPKDIEDAKTWAFFERYTSVNEYGKETGRLRLALYVLVAFGVLINVGAIASGEFESSGLTITIEGKTVFTAILFPLSFVVALIINRRAMLLQQISDNLYEYFTTVEPSEYAKFTMDYYGWRSEHRPDTNKLEDAMIRQTRLLDFVVLGIFAFSFVVPILNLFLSAE